MKKLKAVFSLALALFVFAGCKKDKDPVAPVTPNITAEFYFTAKIDGADHLLQALVDGYGSGAGASSGNSNNGKWEENQSFNLLNMTTQQGSGVVLVKEYNAKPTDCSEIASAFKVGNYPYGAEGKNNNPAVEGMIVYHVDANGKYWSSELGTADQTGSSFQVLEQSPLNDGFANGITKAKFNCRLYDGQGNSKTLTNGEIRSRSVQCGHL